MRRYIGKLFFIGIAVVTFIYFSRSIHQEASMLFVNGVVYTLDGQNSVAQAVAVKGDKILATGSSDELMQRYRAKRVVDLKGKTVFPGFIDAHAHMNGLGQLLRSVMLVGVRSPEEAVRMVGERIAQGAPGELIRGRGWDQNLWESKQFPTAAMLDAVAPNVPVLLIRIDGHAIWVNSKAMEIAGIGKATPNPKDGTIIRSSDGTPTGVFIDNARDLVENVLPALSEPEIEGNIIRAADACIKAGITEVGDMGLDSLDLAIYQRLAASGRLPVRIYGAISVPSRAWDSWSKREPLVGAGGGMLTVRAMKMYIDGALGSRGAALVEPYSDDPGNRGVTIASQKELNDNFRIALQKGYQPCVHAIGDRGNHIALDAYERVLKEVPAGDYRPRIEHAQVLLPTDIDRFKKLGVLPSMQPIHATSDMYWAEARLGHERIKGAYAWRSLLNTGVVIPGGSDFPNDGMYPLWGFFAAVTRSDRDGYPADGWYREQRMTREEGARCFTEWAAYAGFEETKKGTIEPGKLADLTVLSKDIMQITPQEILTTEVEMTVVGGKIVYESAPKAQ